MAFVEQQAVLVGVCVAGKNVEVHLLPSSHLLNSKECLWVCMLQAGVEFLLLAQQPQRAFELAQTHDEMDAYVRLTESANSAAEAARVGDYYEARGAAESAGDSFVKAGQLERAMQLYIKVGS